jgi:tryptophan-rich sensory protein
MSHLLMYPATGRRSLAQLALVVGLVLLVSWLGGRITQTSLGDWYLALRRPFFNPPGWVFPVAWTALFAMMAAAFWRVLRYPEGQPGRREAILAFMVQITLNAGWSFAFFGARDPLAGLVVVVAMFAAILWTIIAFGRVDRLAARLLWPYLAWVGFAAVLNATIVWMNR